MDTFTIVRLWEIPQERVLTTNAYALWPLASAMAGANVESTIKVAQRIIEAPVALDERRELTGLLFTLAGLRLPLGEQLAQVRRHPMIDELLRESGVSQEFIREGMERGRDEGVRTAVWLALEGRLGALDADLRGGRPGDVGTGIAARGDRDARSTARPPGPRVVQCLLA